MGKRKSKKAPARKKRAGVPTVFNCPFCNHKESVSCTMDRVQGRAKIECRVCKTEYECSCEEIHEPIDIYSEWIDQCAILAQQEEENERQRAGIALPTVPATNTVDDIVNGADDADDDDILAPVVQRSIPVVAAASGAADASGAVADDYFGDHDDEDEDAYLFQNQEGQATVHH
eukprot:TRINITY_DN6770_c0_g1_i1.p1 TRINITY_DN6770_c0_g1~~TRINITY_DN6770_c0_g1_i1.p1  ORF type:complete len:202 (-),score=36.10 TRINITY_DN6770_c0_g1_i1:25-546(-)